MGKTYENCPLGLTGFRVRVGRADYCQGYWGKRRAEATGCRGSECSRHATQASPPDYRFSRLAGVRARLNQEIADERESEQAS
jgi:hypothetical protein